MMELLILYRNYLAALQEYLENGGKYGDTKELIEMYEEKLEKVKVKVKRYANEERSNRR